MKKFEIGASEMLLRDQLKSVMGGDGPNPDSCGYSNSEGTACGVPKWVALSRWDMYGGNWCCESCDQTSYCGGGGSNI